MDPNDFYILGSYNNKGILLSYLNSDYCIENDRSYIYAYDTKYKYIRPIELCIEAVVYLNYYKNINIKDMIIEIMGLTEKVDISNCSYSIIYKDLEEYQKELIHSDLYHINWI